MRWPAPVAEVWTTMTFLGSACHDGLKTQETLAFFVVRVLRPEAL